MRRLFNKRTYVVFGILGCIFMWLCFGTESMAFTRTTGEVTGSSVKIRSDASTSAEVVAGVRAGDQLDVVNAIEGTDGNVWYKVLVSADVYGYIRSDFVTLATGEQGTSNNNTTTTPQTNTATPTTEVTPVNPQNGHTSTSNVKVRAGAGTNTAELDRLDQATVFSITGTAKDGSNKTWYQVSYLKNGTEIEGFIRSDLVTIMEEEPEEPEEPEESATEPEEPVEDTPEDGDDSDAPKPLINYEAVYTTNENGEYVWYLYDRTAGQRYKINELLQVEKDDQNTIEELSSANLGLKIGLIIAICLLVMMAVAVVFYLMKIREEEESTTYRRPASDYDNGQRSRIQTTGQQGRSQGTTQSRTQSKPVTRSQGAENGRTQSVTRVQNSGQVASESVQRTQGTIRTTAKAPNAENVPEQRKTSWKAKNFLEDNDEFEFGFLDFDEDDE